MGSVSNGGLWEVFFLATHPEEWPWEEGQQMSGEQDERQGDAGGAAPGGGDSGEEPNWSVSWRTSSSHLVGGWRPDRRWESTSGGESRQVTSTSFKRSRVAGREEEL